MDDTIGEIRRIALIFNQMRQEHQQYNIRCVALKDKRQAIEYLCGKPDQDKLTIHKLSIETEQLETQLKTRSVHLTELLNRLVTMNNETVRKLKSYQDETVLTLLAQWKRSQQLSMNGVPFNNNLEQLQDMCERQAQSLMEVRQHIRIISDYCQVLHPNQTNQIELRQTVQANSILVLEMLDELVKFSFVVETQPPQVLKTNRIFSVKARLLVGQSLNLNINPPLVKITVINETQARNKTTGIRMNGNGASGEIINNEGAMEYNNGQLSATFNNLKMGKVKRAHRRSTEHVVDEKFTLLFQTEFGVGGGELQFNIWTMSVPVVIIVHSHQEPDAWATISWDNHFSQNGRIPFAVADQAPFREVADILNRKFQTFLEVRCRDRATKQERAIPGRELNEEQLRYLADKALRGQGMADWPNAMISWSQFAKQKLPDRDFTFWQWFFAILKMCKDHLKGIWNDGHVMGFVGRRQADHMLSNCQIGTFVIRFSDSELGGVTVAWSGPRADQGVGGFSVRPFITRDLEIRGLADRLHDLKHLQLLYPLTDKDGAFHNYYSKRDTTKTNSNSPYYIESQLRTVIPGWSEETKGTVFTPPMSNESNGDHPMIDDQYDDTRSIQSYDEFMGLDLNSQLGDNIDLSDFEFEQ